MAPEKQAYTRLDIDSVYQLIAMHRSAVTQDSLYSFFGQDRSSRIDALLTKLAKQGKIENGKRGFRAIQPWADVALATIGPVSAEKRAKIYILNLPADVKLNASIARSDIQKQGLKEGDRVIVSLTRGQAGTDDLRGRFVAVADHTKLLRLSGQFNAASGIFTTKNYNFQTAFKLSQDPKNNNDHTLAELPKNFDMRNPVLVPLEYQDIDPMSRVDVSHIIAQKHDIAHAHPQAILEEAAILAQRPVALDGRIDLRDLDFVTVDPYGARDLDDAMCARVEGDGYAFYTAIADVPYIVPYRSAVDRDAYTRGLTHYLANNHTAHMLPSVISTDKCSLVANEDRAAIVVKQILDRNFQMTGFEIFPAVIKSKQQFTYGEFYDLVSSEDPRFIVLSTIHDTRRRQNFDKAFLSANAERYSSKSIVETAMVQTNSLAAKFLTEAGMPFLSRNYSQTAAGYPVKNGIGTRAFYAPFQIGHESLGLIYYAHISSPIRRYGDNINIRALHACFKTPGLGIDAHQIEHLAADAIHLNGRRDTDHQMMQEISRFPAIERAKAMGLIPK